MPGKIEYQREALVQKLAGVKRAGGKIVFTNGCFDIIHAGHTEYLKQARALGDHLVVGVNTDSSVRALKGPGRPIMDLDHRMKVLSALTCVDTVVPFHEATPYELIVLIRPDVIVKGGDYNVEKMIGRTFVESYGGSAVILKYMKGVSTTQIIHKIKELDAG